MRFRVFGDFGVDIAAGFAPLGASRPSAVLAILLMTPGVARSVDEIAELLWGESQPDDADHALRVTVSRLRTRLKELGISEEVVASRSGGYLADVPREDVDASRFQDLAGAALAAPGPERLALANQALDVFVAEPMRDFAYEDFAVDFRDRLMELRGDLLEVWAEAALLDGKSALVIDRMSEAVSIYPLRERLWAALVTALYRDSRQADALRALSLARDELGQLGLELGPVLSGLEQSIFERDPSLGGLSPRSNLPLQVDQFVGRASELEGIRRLVDESRLTTLVGPGGVGKTRLALESAARVSDRFDQVVVVDLVPARSEESIVEALTDALCIGPYSVAAPLESIILHLQGKRVLVLLDNCEHLIDAAAIVADTLIRSAPEVVLLATSREPLRIHGERVMKVPTLGLPEPGATPEEMRESEAVALFVSRAGSAGVTVHEDEVELVAEVVQALDGIPLALELAAVRTPALSLAEMSARLDDVFGALGRGARTALPRHRTLHAAIAWSIDLLEPDERSALVRLGVLNSGFGLEAVSAVTGVANAETVAESLVEKSLLSMVYSTTGRRFRWLEPVRQYVAKSLAASGDLAEATALRDGFYSRLAEDAGGGSRRWEDAWWLAAIAEERSNLVAMLDHLLVVDAKRAVRLAVPIAAFWLQLGLYDSGLRIVNAAVDADDATDPALRLELFTIGAMLATHQGSYPTAEGLIEEGERWAIRHQLPASGLANVLGSLHAERGELKRAAVLLERAQERSTTREEEIAPTINLAAVLAWMGRFDDSRSVLSRLDGVLAGSRPDAAIAPYRDVIMGICARMDGDVGLAATLFDRGIEGFAITGSAFHRAIGEVEAGIAAAELGRLEAAVEYCGLLKPESGSQLPLLYRIRAMNLMGRVEMGRGDVSSSATWLRQAIELSAVTRTAWGVMDAADVLAIGLAQMGEPADGQVLVEGSSSLRAAFGPARDPWETHELTDVGLDPSTLAREVDLGELTGQTMDSLEKVASDLVSRCDDADG